MKKAILVLLFISVIQNALAQSEDHYEFMEASRTSILKTFTNLERIYTGDYKQLVYNGEDDTKFYFYFNDENKCYMFLILKETDFLERAKITLSSTYPNKKDTGDIIFFWNERMMCSLLIDEDNLKIVFQKVLPELLNQK